MINYDIHKFSEKLEINGKRIASHINDRFIILSVAHNAPSDISWHVSSIIPWYPEPDIPYRSSIWRNVCSNIEFKPESSQVLWASCGKSHDVDSKISGTSVALDSLFRVRTILL